MDFSIAPMKEHHRLSEYELDIQHSRWMLLFEVQEQAVSPQGRELFLLPPPPPMALLPAEVPSTTRAVAFPRESVVFEAPAAAPPIPADGPGPPKPSFTERLEALRPRITQLIRNRWWDEYDAYELDNLVQAGMVHLWLAYEREPAAFDHAGDGYWYRTAREGAKQEVIRGYRQRFRQQGTGSSRNRQHIETVLSLEDLLERVNTRYDGDGDEPDATVLDRGTVYARETPEVETTDIRLVTAELERAIYGGTDPADHPLIGRILEYMRDGVSVLSMAREARVSPSTIRRTINRMRRACGAVETAKTNKRRDYGDSKDARIRLLREQGCSGPAIARLIGTENKFVYTRLHAMGMMGEAASTTGGAVGAERERGEEGAL